MRQWFTCKVKYFTEDEQGTPKGVTDAYLVDAVSYTEAESRIYEALDGVIHGDHEVTQITKSNYSDVFDYEETLAWYKCKIQYVSVDEKSEKERKVTNQLLISADSVVDACERIGKEFSTMLVPYTITMVSEIALKDVFPYEDTQVIDGLKVSVEDGEILS
ncbi:MAG: DUF4494 domain-containing protein [Cytophagales bacterium]|nr:DUF4494 domain-containing protein [Cytophagales bacterium]